MKLRRGWALLALCGLMGVALAGGAQAQDSTPKDIVDTAVQAGSFKTLVAAVKAAGLVDTLKGDGPFTVFAPTDDAFKKLEKAKPGILATLLKPENKAKSDRHPDLPRRCGQNHGRRCAQTQERHACQNGQRQVLRRG